MRGKRPVSAGARRTLKVTIKNPLRALRLNLLLAGLL